MQLLEGCLNPRFDQRLQNAAAAIELVPATASTANHSVNRGPVAEDFSRHIVNGVLLRVMQGEEYGRVYYLDDMLTDDCALLTMGRRDPGVKNDIDIKETQSSYMSRRHCTFELDYNLGLWVVRDGQWVMHTGSGQWRRSTNGTFVNSTEASADGLPVNPGDIISVGDVKLRAEAY